MNDQDNVSKIGQSMVYTAWILLLIILSYFFNQYLEQQNNPNQNVAVTWVNNIAEVRLQQNRYGHYVANGQINNAPVTFLLDTGATLISIPETLAEKIGLSKGYPSQSKTANGIITVFETRLDKVSIGAIELNNIRASINPHMKGEEVLLGMSFMKQVEITQKGDELILKH